MLSDEWLSRYGHLENFNASAARTRTTGVTAIALCTSWSRAKNVNYFVCVVQTSNLRKSSQEFFAKTSFYNCRKRDAIKYLIVAVSAINGTPNTEHNLCSRKNMIVYLIVDRVHMNSHFLKSTKMMFFCRKFFSPFSTKCCLHNIF